MDVLKALLASTRALMVAYVAGSIGSASAQTDDPEEQLWNQALERGTVEAFQRYLEEYPVGRHASEAFRYIVEGTVSGPSGDIPSLDEPGPQTSGIVADLY